MWELIRIQKMIDINNISFDLENISTSDELFSLSFMHSQAWLKFLYHNYKHLLILKNTEYKIVWPLQLVSTHFGKILWGRHLLLSRDARNNLSAILTSLAKFLKHDVKKSEYLDAIGIRLHFRSLCLKNDILSRYLCSNGHNWYDSFYQWHVSPIHEIDFERTIIIDLRKKFNFSNIVIRTLKKSNKLGFEVNLSNSKHEICKFYDLYRLMFKRKGFNGASKNYICNQYLYLKRANQAYLLWVNKNKKKFYGAIYLTDPTNKVAYYVHGAGKYNPKIAFGYVIHFYAINLFREMQFNYVDLGGVGPYNVKHPLYKNSIIKKRFGGSTYKFWHAIELPLSYKWYLYGVNSYLKNLVKGWYKE